MEEPAPRASRTLWAATGSRCFTTTTEAASRPIAFQSTARPARTWRGVSAGRVSVGRVVDVCRGRDVSRECVAWMYRVHCAHRRQSCARGRGAGTARAAGWRPATTAGRRHRHRSARRTPLQAQPTRRGCRRREGLALQVLGPCSAARLIRRRARRTSTWRRRERLRRERWPWRRPVPPPPPPPSGRTARTGQTSHRDCRSPTCSGPQRGEDFSAVASWLLPTVVLARGELDRLEGPGYAARRTELRKAKEAARTRDRQAAAAQDEAEENDATEEEMTRERTTRVGRPRGGGMKVAARSGERLRREIGRGRLPRVGDG